MARPLSSTMTAAILARDVRLAILCDLMFPSAPSYVWGGTGTLSANGNTYLGLGPVGAIGKVEEKSDGKATGLSLSLSGVPLSQISEAVNTNYQGSPVNLWMACFDSSWNLLNYPYQLFGGSMDVMSIQDGTSTATITMAVESRLIETQRPRTRRYTQDDQQLDYPSDTGFQFVNNLQLMQIYWGNPNGPSINLPGSTGVTQNVIGSAP